ncbi:sugar phosphate isomerase/epimerase family protein [Planctomonas psychrotolerans]|uniref:sugar phosphate isomerase/epimerase family protein n=1 Tax=Planctomonas psychrotolerans TaxID=2528712 RepID=UPI001D0D1263|nr:sugar phosphate isomerase/epimerase [Planctomonas psychrotolerans]
MPITLGCFALVDPFSTLDHQLDRVRDWGFSFADVTDTGDGAVLGNHFGFTAVASLDANPWDIKRLFDERGLTITSYCAHSDLLDPTAPWRYGTSQIMKAVRAAGTIGVKHVVTTEGEPVTAFGHGLSFDEAIFTIAEKLHEPLRVAEDYGVTILLEPHGPYTGTIDGTSALLERIDSPALGLNLDTGNLWLAGSDPVEYVRTFGDRIQHVHWKDLGAEWEEKRGSVFGCGMSTIAVGSGVIDIDGAFAELQAVGYDGHSTLEVGGDDAVLGSAEYLVGLGAVK